MKDLFCSYEQSLALKEIGFDEPCFTFYPKEGKMGFDGKYHSIKEGYRNSTVNDIWIKKYKKDFECIAAPLKQQVLRWFREEHGLYSSIVPKKSYPDNYVSGVEWYVNICGGNGESIGPEGVYSYSEAEDALIDKLIEIVKQK